MSHSSKADLLNLAKIYGYKTYFYFVFTSNMDTNLARAKLRVIDGGHDVNEKLILERAPRVFNLLPDAFLDADSSFIIDNSDQPKLILKKEADLLYTSKDFPEIITPSIEKIYAAFPKPSMIKDI
jgi:predicted ABC-type ATPase